VLIPRKARHQFKISDITKMTTDNSQWETTKSSWCR